MLMRMQGKGNSYILVVEVQTGTITVEINLAIPGEAGKDLPQESAIFIMLICSKDSISYYRDPSHLWSSLL